MAEKQSNVIYISEWLEQKQIQKNTDSLKSYEEAIQEIQDKLNSCGLELPYPEYPEDD